MAKIRECVINKAKNKSFYEILICLGDLNRLS